TATTSADEWYVVGIGRVRAVTATRIGSLPEEVETEELVAYGVGGRRSDTVAPRVLQAVPADGDAGPAPAAFTLRVSERLDPNSLEGDEGLILLDAQGLSVPASRQLSSDGLEITLVPATALAEGRYTVRAGSAVVDWANNALVGAEVRYAVDLSGPRIAASLPARDSADFLLTGPVSLTFDEDVAAVGAGPLFLEITDPLGSMVVQRLPATLAGRTLSATVTTPLVRNTPYALRPGGDLSDAAGNVLRVAAALVPFRTDPGPLARPVPLVEGSEVFGVRLADLDGDGRADLVFVGAENTDQVPYLGLRPALATGGFGPVQRLVTLGAPSSCSARVLAIADFDGDGRRDVALVCDPFLRVYLQTTPGGFVRETPGFNGSSGFGVADLDGDGRDDLVLIGTAPGMDVGGMSSWHVITRSGGGGWSSLANVPLGAEFAFPCGAALADVDGDGKADLVWVRRYQDGRHELAWALRQGSGFASTRSAPIVTGAGFFADLAVGDFDGDGSADAAVVGFVGDRHLLALLRGDGGNAFATPELLETARSPEGVAAGDINADGRTDLLLNHGGDRFVGVIVQGVAGRLEPERLFETSFVASGNGRSLLVLDVDGDGLLDLVAQRDVLAGRTIAQAWPAAVDDRAYARARSPRGRAPRPLGALSKRR
ncbi:MAG: VCBS repeat-containing protein, partial [Rubrivivax sp.]|nr:VCBS repeat-containing protein [Rubrivivax sp.]